MFLFNKNNLLLMLDAAIGGRQAARDPGSLVEAKFRIFVGAIQVGGTDENRGLRRSLPREVLDDLTEWS